ncbi:MAG: hypothetical protein Q9167_006237 [Letrouitia subvulpina]
MSTFLKVSEASATSNFNITRSFLPHLSHFLYPITALAFVQTRSRLLLLAGEGSFLKLFDHDTNELLLIYEVFQEGVVHGISTCPQISGKKEGLSVTNVFIWGGRSFSSFELFDHGDLIHDNPFQLCHKSPEMHAEDWILDACFRRSEVPEVKDIFFVTAHNVVFSLRVSRHHNDCGMELSCAVERISSGPKSMLYSAHVEWYADGERLLVAVGTVLGEVLFWSFPIKEHFQGFEAVYENQSHHIFVGHEGSVFGIRIFAPVRGDMEGKRLLASCSDDRTVRVWDVTNLDIGKAEATDDDKARRGLAGCVATVMGHASRIWGVKFLLGRDDQIYVLSGGEDGTSQLWRFESQSNKEPAKRDARGVIFNLSHQMSFGYQFGRNLWATDVYQLRIGNYVICTGGADRRIASYILSLNDKADVKSMMTSQWRMQDMAAQLSNSQPLSVSAFETAEQEANKKEPLSQWIFEKLGGIWNVSRTISSALPTYPSGVFKGEAVFEQRPPTNEEFRAEYLYVEQGKFTTNQGVEFQASRSYVYRLEKDQDVVSAWFVKPDDNTTVDYLFHQLRFTDQDSRISNAVGAEKGRSVLAEGYHLCVEDHYSPFYVFSIDSRELTDWSLQYSVTGPQKDYVTQTQYTRSTEIMPKAAQTSNNSPAKDKHSKTNESKSKLAKGGIAADSMKTYVWLSSGAFFVTTTHGGVLLAVMQEQVQPQNLEPTTHMFEWRIIKSNPDIGSLGVAARDLHSDVIFFGGDKGAIYYYQHTPKCFEQATQLPGKVTFLYAHSIPNQATDTSSIMLFVTCLGSSTAHIYKGRPLPNSSTCSFELFSKINLPEDFIVTSSCLIQSGNILLLGFRNGAVASYHLTQLSRGAVINASNLVHEIHGEDAVTCIRQLPEKYSNSDRCFITTTGRNGHYAVHQMNSVESRSVESHSSGPRCEFETVHQGSPPFGPYIESAIIDPTSKDLLVWGFRSKNFVVWNETQNQELMSVECGGAHRNWAFRPRLDGRGGGDFVWTKASVCYVHSQSEASHKVLQTGGHGREIKALTISPFIKTDSICKRRYTATGAEDTAIRIFDSRLDQADHTQENLQCLQILTKHTAGIQQLKWSSDGSLLFSAAGCEEFFVWRFRAVPCLQVGVICEAICPTVSGDGDLRIMDFAIKPLHCSQNPDSNTAISQFLLSMVYQYTSSSPKKSHFRLLNTGTYSTYCLTQALYLDFNSCLHLCTASSDGYIVTWPMESPSVTKAYQDTSTPSIPIYWQNRARVHQNSIKSMASVQLSEKDSLFVSGGDDGAVGLTRITWKESDLAFSSMFIPKAHASAVNAVEIFQLSSRCGNKLLDCVRFVSSGNDQRLRFWQVRVDLEQPGVEGFTIQKEYDAHSSVADLSCLATALDDENNNQLFVAGIGLEMWNIKMKTDKTTPSQL